MAETRRGADSLGEISRTRILGPLDAAAERLETELEKVSAEQRAFEQFRDRIESLDGRSTSAAEPGRLAPLCGEQTDAGPADRVRTAFRETVMAVDHYGELYDESLEKHAAAELSPEAAACFRRESPAPFSAFAKATLRRATDQAIKQRAIIRDELTAERDSLGHARDVLDGLLESRDGAAPLLSGGESHEALLVDIHERHFEVFYQFWIGE